VAAFGLRVSLSIRAVATACGCSEKGRPYLAAPCVTYSEFSTAIDSLICDLQR
jgi:hypothetical protein